MFSLKNERLAADDVAEMSGWVVGTLVSVGTFHIGRLLLIAGDVSGKGYAP